MFILLQCSEYDCQQICSHLCEPLHCTYMENASFVNMEPILVPGDQINHTDFVGDQSKLFLTSGTKIATQNFEIISSFVFFTLSPLTSFKR